MGVVQTVATTESDPASKHPLRVIQGIDDTHLTPSTAPGK